MTIVGRVVVLSAVMAIATVEMALGVAAAASAVAKLAAEAAEAQFVSGPTKLTMQ